MMDLYAFALPARLMERETQSGQYDWV